MPESRRLESVGLGDDHRLRRLPSWLPRQPGGQHRRRRDHRTQPPVVSRDQAPLHRGPRPGQSPASSRPPSPATPSLDVVHEINDISLVGVVHPDLGPGHDLWVGGGSSTAPRLAEWIGVFGQRTRQRRCGTASSRSSATTAIACATKARLKFLLADWGVERFRQVLGTNTSGTACPTGPAPRCRPSPATTSGSTPRGRTLLRRCGSPRSAGSGITLAGLADLMDRVGAGRVPSPAFQSSSFSTCRPTAWTTSSPDCRSRPDRNPRARSGARRWPAPASGSASWRSSTPRTPRPGSSVTSRQRLGRCPARSADRPEPQRLPQLVRPDPDSRHRPQGQGDHRRRQQVAGYQGAPGWRTRRRGARGGRTGPDRAWPQGAGDRTRRLRGAPHPPFCRCPRAPVNPFAQWAHRADEALVATTSTTTHNTDDQDGAHAQRRRVACSRRRGRRPRRGGAPTKIMAGSPSEWAARWQWPVPWPMVFSPPGLATGAGVDVFLDTGYPSSKTGLRATRWPNGSTSTSSTSSRRSP